MSNVPSDNYSEDDLFDDIDTIRSPSDSSPSRRTPLLTTDSNSSSNNNPFASSSYMSYSGGTFTSPHGPNRQFTNSSYGTIVDEYGGIGVSGSNEHEGIGCSGGTDFDDDDDDMMSDFYPKKSKTVAFDDEKLKYPPTAYNPGTSSQTFDFEYDMDDNEKSLRMNGSDNFLGDNYMINPLVDADEGAVGDDDDDDDDIFDDDDSLFSSGDAELIRRATTLKRRGGLIGTSIQKTKSRGSTITFDDEEFKKLTYTKTIKKAKLINGNYVIDVPAPKALLEKYEYGDGNGGNEMKFLRYTAATCGPSNYTKFNYNLRQALYEPHRETEIMIMITMYNEDENLLARTLKGVFENVSDLSRRSDATWGEDSWKKIVICIVSDGRLQLNKRTQTLLTALGIYQDGYAKSKINDKSVKAHIYEYTSAVGIDTITDHNVNLCTNENPIQFIFCLKEHNLRKINSHRWCFQAFAPILNPKIVMLLDCGTRPSKNAFFYLWRSFKDENVAGACGEMRASLGPGKKLLANPLVAAQNFEYKISNILDKPMESVFGFISVLPGAFSAYRYEALLNVNGEGPLEKYFKGEYLHQSTAIGNNGEEEDDEKEIKERNFQEAGIFTSNMYLAEDRILCFELVAKKSHKYRLRYVKEAKAETDVPERIDEFVLQRRRWLNGSMFAAAYAVFHWTKIWRSDHSLMRKLFLQWEFYYQLVTILVSWFSLASFFLVFRILTANLGAVDMNFETGKYLAVIFEWFYVGCIVVTFVLAFGNSPRGTRKFYLVVSYIFAIMMAYMMFAAIFLAVHTASLIYDQHRNDFKVILVFTNQKFRDLVVSMVSTYILYFVGAFLYGQPSFMFTSFVQYVLLSPTYINVLNIYSFCNIHDVSWGTKGVEQAKDLGSAKFIGQDNQNIVLVAPEINQEYDDVYLASLDKLKQMEHEPTIDKINSKKFKDDSYYAFIRTITVLMWMLTNAILVAIVLRTMGVDILSGLPSTYTDGSIAGNSQIFLSIILWIVAGLAIFRFLGCVLYLLGSCVRPMKWKFMARKERKRQRRMESKSVMASHV
ncbi:hypothetical protein KGF56_004620 [Candida oxycetoniae]|uniref:chitin synthase n=1 Tax=Candida oxycetoniae TaxID=497107 RepID=A0AAI9WW33_9ASCO|nr:uncharacterized protein KGF56_004620 [Candida oxycetoniae]KAI3402528.2 hypothetical protein KGF56_004620 [Candida oxycetoniae]